jgi:excisionase family DNA binding protein
MAKDSYEPPIGYLTVGQVQAQLGVSRPTLLRLLKSVGVNVYEDPRDRRMRLLRAEDVEALRQPRLRVA